MIRNSNSLTEYVEALTKYQKPIKDRLLFNQLKELDEEVKRFTKNEGGHDIIDVDAWLKHTGADYAKLNVNGGAIALGHPLGASGTKLMSTLVHALKARGKKYGLQTMCEGGGIANVTIIEAL